jgi:hypothetical protein
MLSIFGVSLVLYFVKILSGSKKILYKMLLLNFVCFFILGIGIETLDTIYTRKTITRATRAHYLSYTHNVICWKTEEIRRK